MKAEKTRNALNNRISWNKNIDRNCKCVFCENQINVENELNEFERLAEIGQATEQWFKEGHIMEYAGNEVYGIEDLLDWAVEND